MRGIVLRDLSDSSADFQRVVWPAVHDWCGGGTIALVESSCDLAMRRNFDALAGIDAWQVIGRDGLMRGIASRVQWGAAWDSFTVRVRRPNGQSTEAEKRIRALLDDDAGWVHPALTVQAYVSERGGTGQLLHVLMARTNDVYRFAVEHHDQVERRTNGADGVEFWVIWAGDLRRAGVKVRHRTSADVEVRGRRGGAPALVTVGAQIHGRLA